MLFIKKNCEEKKLLLKIIYGKLSIGILILKSNMPADNVDPCIDLQWNLNIKNRFSLIQSNAKLENN